MAMEDGELFAVGAAVPFETRDEVDLFERKQRIGESADRIKRLALTQQEDAATKAEKSEEWIEPFHAQLVEQGAVVDRDGGAATDVLAAGDEIQHFGD